MGVAMQGSTVVSCLLSLSFFLASADMPHVSTCNFCQTCHIGDKPPATSMRSLLGEEGMASAIQQAVDWAGKLASKTKGGAVSRLGSRTGRALNHRFEVKPLHSNLFLASAGDMVPKQVQANCTECYGCNTQLSHMSASAKAFGISFINEKGATSSWLFRATTPLMPSGLAVVKVYCVPVPKREGGRVPTCSPITVQKNMQLLQALEQLVEECGLQDILPAVWVDRVDGVMPDLGYHIRWHGLWMELVQGVSLENLLNKGEPRMSPQGILDLIQNKLNKTQIVRAAIFDLLTSQCDRHSQNIFIDENGNLKLIDNEAALQNSWKNCGFDSIFIPNTQKQNIVRFSNEFILKYVTPAEAKKRNVDPQLLLDYRCYLGEGKDELGTDYPADIKQCLTKISSMTVDQVKTHYGLAEDLPARNLHTRATDMLNKGFEWAYKFGEPRNAPPKRYMVQPKCCRVDWTEGGYRCGHDYNPKWEIPIGDPVTGREWTKPRPDTGTYEGGSTYEQIMPLPQQQ